MKVTLNTNICIVTRGDSPKTYRDSTLMTWVKRELQSQGYDVITKDLSKEPGNLLSDGCFGVIARDRSFVIWDTNYCIDYAYMAYNAGELRLTVER
jgi:hypothetical protein